MLAFGWIDSIHEDDITALLLGLRKAVENESIFEQDVRVQKQGDTVGWINVRASLTRNEHAVIDGCLLVAMDISDRRSVEIHLDRMAHLDDLTGLPNRLRFQEELADILSAPPVGGPHCAALLYVDLDGFKSVNDSYGHDYGDALLCAAADRLRQVVRESDVVARLSGDEFAVILVGCHDENTAMQVGEDILQRIRDVFSIKDVDVYVSASIGVAMTRAGELPVDEFVKRADIALYRAKSSGRARCVVYSNEIDRQQRRHAMLVDRLWRAVDRREFHLVYQPQVGVDGQSLHGFEVLLRWHGDTAGDYDTREVIAVLENSGLISDIGQWLLDHACRQFVEWQHLGFVGAGVSLSVNVSMRQLSHPSFVDRLAQTLGRTRMPAGDLVLEITESVVVDGESGAIDVIRQIKSLGVRIALDDFGTGYSSLSSLAQLPVDYLKIDRSLIALLESSSCPARQGNEHSIVTTIIALASALGIPVIAEGVEDTRVLAMLIEQRCSLFQGFLFSRPLMPAGVEAWLLRRRGNALVEWPGLIDLGVADATRLSSAMV